MKNCDVSGCTKLAAHVVYSGELRKGYERILLCSEHHARIVK